MRKVQVRYTIIVAFFALIALLVGMAFGFARTDKTASAAPVSLTSIFSPGSGSEVVKGEAEEGETSYLTIKMSDNGKAYYRNNLALKWFEAETDEEIKASSPLANLGKKVYFSFSFAFENFVFEKFTIAFDCAEENITKDGKSTNSVVFTKNGEVANVSIVNAEGEEKTTTVTVASGEKITLSLSEDGCDVGEFALNLAKDDGASEFLGNFTNIGANFLEYSTTKSTLPMTFIAELAEGETEKQLVKTLSLNGQTFEVNEDGKVVDNASPVLVLNEELYAFRLGQKFNLSYQVIDVCDSSVTPTREYYMLKYNAEDDTPVKPQEKTEGDKKTDYKTLSNSTIFLPVSNSGSTREHVSIHFVMKDDNGNEATSFLSWYVAEGSGAVETLGTGENQFDYIVVDREKQAPTFVGITAEAGENKITSAATNAKNDYQDALNAVAQKISVGSGAEIYLPSFRGLITSDSADYRNLTFNIYYWKPSQAAGATASSETALSYNSLRLDVTEEGTYRFRVFAKDSAGNVISLYNEDGDLVELTADNVWDIEAIPEFTFTVTYSGAVIEEAGEQTIGYQNGKYTVDEFEIISLDHEEEYKLYFFDKDKVSEGQTVPNYSQFVKNAEQYMVTYSDAIREITVYNDDVEEDDDEWDNTDNDYSWKPTSSLSFIPQEVGFYIVELTLTDNVHVGETQTAYQVIDVRNPIDRAPVKSEWLQDNLLSVILFAIAGVLAVAIVVLFVVRPSEKKVEEVDIEKLKGKKKNK